MNTEKLLPNRTKSGMQLHSSDQPSPKWNSIWLQINQISFLLCKYGAKILIVNAAIYRIALTTMEAHIQRNLFEILSNQTEIRLY